jgi:hypothetical protein
VALQLILVAVVIFWPGSVTYWLDKGPALDLKSIQIEAPQIDSGDDGDVDQPPDMQ